MKEVSVADFKARFSTLLEEVKSGKSVAIQYGRRKEIVAVLAPPPPAASARSLGVLKGKAHFRLKPGFKISEEELLGG